MKSLLFSAAILLAATPAFAESPSPQLLQLGVQEDIALPNCQTVAKLRRVDNVLTLYINGGEKCGNIGLHGRHFRSMSRLFGTYAGVGIPLKEEPGESRWTFTLSNKEGTLVDVIEVKSVLNVIKPKTTVDLSLIDTPAAELPNCGGFVAAQKSILDEVQISFTGVEACDSISLMMVDNQPVSGTNFLEGYRGALEGVFKVSRDVLPRDATSLIFKVSGVVVTRSGREMIVKDVIFLRLR